MRLPLSIWLHALDFRAIYTFYSPRKKQFVCISAGLFFLSMLLLSNIVFAQTASQTNLALNKYAFSSSNEEPALAAAFAFDGSSKSRWSSRFADDQWLAVDLGENYYISGIKLHWQNSHGREYLIQTSGDGNEWKTIHTQLDGKGGIETFNVNGEGRYVRMFGLKRFTRYGFSLFEFEVYGHLPGINRALYKSVSTSTIEEPALHGANAVDGNSKSRWSSSFSDNQWIAIDLGEYHRIKGVRFHWQNSYAREYRIETSNDGEHWKTAFYEPDGDGGIDHIALNTGGRFVRMFGLKRFTRYGFSLFEFEVFGYPTEPEQDSTEPEDPIGETPVTPVEPEPQFAVNASAYEDHIELSWNPAKLPDDTVSIKVFRNELLLTEVSVDQTSFTDSDVQHYQAYRYQLFTCTRSGECVAFGVATEKQINPEQQITLSWAPPGERENGQHLFTEDIGGYEIRFITLDGERTRALTIHDPASTRLNIGEDNSHFLFEIATFDKQGLYSLFVPIEP